MLDVSKIIVTFTEKILNATDVLYDEFVYINVSNIYTMCIYLYLYVYICRVYNRCINKAVFIKFVEFHLSYSPQIFFNN